MRSISLFHLTGCLKTDYKSYLFSVTIKLIVANKVICNSKAISSFTEFTESYTNIQTILKFNENKIKPIINQNKLLILKSINQNTPKYIKLL